MRRSRWAALAYVAGWAGVMVLGQVLLLALLERYVSLPLLVPAVIIVAVALGVRQLRRGGEPVRDVLRQRRQRARAGVDSVGKLRAKSPGAAGFAALASFPAVFLALVATQSPSATDILLPPAADARWQLWCVAAAALGAVIALDYWHGPGTCARAVAADGFTAAILGVTVALAAASPLMIFWQIGSRPAWLAVAAAQFSWPFAGLFLGAAVSGRRKRRLPPPAPPRAPADDPGEPG